MAEAEDRQSPMRYKKALKVAERKLDETYKAMGVRAYNLVKKGELDAGDLVEVAREIDLITEEVESNLEAIERYKSEKEARKGTKCPSCGRKAAPGARFCPHCGYDLTTTCPRCGGTINAGTAFCVVCGAKVGDTEGPDPGE